jgi:hypothetical protein
MDVVANRAVVLYDCRCVYDDVVADHYARINNRAGHNHNTTTKNSGRGYDRSGVNRADRFKPACDRHVVEAAPVAGIRHATHSNKEMRCAVRREVIQTAVVAKHRHSHYFCAPGSPVAVEQADKVIATISGEDLTNYLRVASGA